MTDYGYKHSHQECPTCLMLSERAERAEAAIVAALDESKATKILCLRIEELKAEVSRLEGLILAWEGYQEGCHADLLVEARRIRALRGGGE